MSEIRPPKPNLLRDSANRIKLGVFATNGGAAFTHHPDRFDGDWETQVRIAKHADELGIEGFISASRWKPFGGDQHYSGDLMETYTWAAAIAASTQRIAVMSTVHMTIIHPVIAAKMATTVDIVSNGRAGMNLVCGWYPAEVAMFDEEIKPHADRYALADEWVEIFDRLYAETKSFDYNGEYYKLRGAINQPRPVQNRPLFMNAGGSPRGTEFAAKNADIAFILAQSTDPLKIKAQVDQYRHLAREKYGKEIQIGISTYVVQRDTRQAAEAYVHDYVVTQGDDAAVAEFIEINVANAKTMPDGVIQQMSFALKAGYGGFPLVGTAEDIANSIKALSDAGIDTILLTWTDYEGGLRAFGKDVLPRLEQMGLREPIAATA
ncbi:LLM class flavin-dependent oxidoreductase [Sphingomonas populi]|uniref:LLM class flavin-dependent oxidoreductase n=2 Tax=Sphingomonas populi TaxID=2484750 RepID=A0A4Q6Y357_9SPHN|nr:LLM class flavin-dependent oxidoreductase [Sphingomonas populi]